MEMKVGPGWGLCRATGVIPAEVMAYVGEVRDIVEDLISGAFNFLGCVHPVLSGELIALGRGWVL